MKYALLALTLACGCATAPRLTDFEASCSQVSFDQYGRCIESSLSAGYPNWRNDKHGDLVEVYISWLNAAGKRVNDGVMDETDARLGAATLKTRLKEMAKERQLDAEISRQASINQMLTGLAIMNAAQPHYLEQPVPSPMVTCIQHAPNMISGQIKTTCQ